MTGDVLQWLSTSWWSLLLTAVGVTGLWFAGRKRKLGWMIGFLAQSLWIAYALATRQYGFLISAACYGWVYGRNFLHWWREERRRPSESREGTDDDRDARPPASEPDRRAGQAARSL